MTAIIWTTPTCELCNAGESREDCVDCLRAQVLQLQSDLEWSRRGHVMKDRTIEVQAEHKRELKAKVAALSPATDADGNFKGCAWCGGPQHLRGQKCPAFKDGAA